MGQKFRKADSKIPGTETWLFWCPGCDGAHAVRTQGEGTTWEFNRNVYSPTLTPSVLVGVNMPLMRCHFHVKDGKIEYLPDCHHDLAGQTVDMPDWDSI